MTETIETLLGRMKAASDALDFDEARRLRDRISLLRGGAGADQALGADTSGLERQEPGRMGLGTSQSRPVRPEGWTPPPKPDLMTNMRRGRRSR